MIQLTQYQQECIEAVEGFGGRALIADEMGLGKTAEALAWTQQHPDRTPVVVICPASVKWVWEEQAKLHFGLRSEVLNGTKPPKSGFSRKPKLIIINYDILQHWLPILKQMKPQIAIVDEVHYIKSTRTIRARATRSLCRKIPYILALSGTPLTNRPAELWSTLNLLDPKTYRKFKPFGDEFCAPRWTPWGVMYDGAAHISRLHRRLSRTLMIRRLKKDVLDQLPNKSRVVVPLDIDNPSEYQEASRHFLQWLHKQSAAKAAKASHAVHMVKLGYLKRLAAQLKLKTAISWISDFLENSEDKLVVFAIHKDIIHQLQQRFPASVVIDGSVTGRARQMTVRKFQQDKKTRLLIGNIKAAGVGITLTASKTVVFLEMEWSPGDHIQAEDRIHRIGQKFPATIYYLVGRNTIEEHLCRILQKKQKVLSAVLDGEMARNQLNVFDELERSIKNEKKRGHTRTKN